MVNKIVSIPGYVHLYRSLLRFYHMPENEIKEMLYVLNTANLDCFGYYHPEIFVVQSGPALFSTWLDNMNYRPYRTEVLLHKALVCLKHSVDREFMTVEQREALQKLRCIISNIETALFTTSALSVLCRTRTSRASALCTIGCICRRRKERRL